MAADWLGVSAVMAAKPYAQMKSCAQGWLLTSYCVSIHSSLLVCPALYYGLAVTTGELALAAPALGISQRLLNKDHQAAYYEGMPAIPGGG